MILEELPFMHFMVRIDGKDASHLITAYEADEDSPLGGVFVVPVQASGQLFPKYRFNFSIYLGRGEYLSSQGRKEIFNGLLISSLEGRKHVLVASFEYPVTEPISQPKDASRLISIPERRDELPVLKFRRSLIPLGRLRYAGILKHRDFKELFVELQTVDKDVLDSLFDNFGVSLIGCDPISHYEKS